MRKFREGLDTYDEDESEEDDVAYFGSMRVISRLVGW